MRQSFKIKPSPKRKSFHQVADNMLIPVIEIDEKFTLTYANVPALELLKLDKAALQDGVSVPDIVVSEQLTQVEEGLSLLRNNVPSVSMSLRVVRGDGLKVPTQVYTNTITEQGKIVGFVVYALDLSRREAAEDKIYARKEILEFMVDYNSFAGMAVIDDKFKLEYVNDKMCSLLGRRRSEILNYDFREFIHPEDIDMVADRYIKRQNGESVTPVYEIRIIQRDSSALSIRINVGTIRSKDGKTKTVAQVVDITDEKLAARALYDSERRYRSLIETMDSGLAVDNTEGKIVLANEALCRMIGCDNAEQLIGVPITDILHGWTENKVFEWRNGKRARLSIMRLF
ncbi:MAG: PAS domain S-box protein [Candidatus Thorarchaeota archaeon]|jgi:PAS domain S-box-containing protein